MTTRSLDKHGFHVIKLIEGPIHTKNSKVTHAGKLMCLKCNKLIKWASQEEVKFFKERYNQDNIRTTYQGFMDRFVIHMNKKSIVKPKIDVIYLVVTYQQKEQVKALGAKWDANHRLWYVMSDNPHLTKLQPWIHPDDKKLLGM